VSTTWQPETVPEKPGAGFLQRVFDALKRGLEDAAPYHELVEMHAAPDKLRTGMVVLADGTDWDPGSGAGVYCYYAGIWNRLG
jgi:hypothetical protein